MTQVVLTCALSSASSGFGLSPTEARPGKAPKYIDVDTEARSAIRQTTSSAPTGAAKANFLRRVGRDDRMHEAKELKCSFDCASGIGPSFAVETTKIRTTTRN